jgi:hypothetical protein
MFTRAHQPSLSWARWLLPTPIIPIYLRKISNIFPSTSISSKCSLYFVLPNKTWCIFLISPMLRVNPSQSKQSVSHEGSSHLIFGEWSTASNNASQSKTVLHSPNKYEPREPTWYCEQVIRTSQTMQCKAKKNLLWVIFLCYSQIKKP